MRGCEFVEFWGATGFDVTQKEPKTDDSLAVFTPHTGLAITCNRLLNMNCVMPSIPAELFHKISLCFAVSPSYAKPRSM